MIDNDKPTPVDADGQGLDGDILEELFRNADAVALLHQSISSPRGDHFRRRLLQKLGTQTSLSEIEQLRCEAGLEESQRHINKLLVLQLIEPDEQGTYKRTSKGEQCINALSALETDVGKAEARRMFTSSLGSNAIRFMLRVYGAKADVDLVRNEIKFTPAEVGKLSLFLPRSIERVAAIDKLSDADVLVYREDGNIYLDAKKTRGFYKYLTSLHEILTHKEPS